MVGRSSRDIDQDATLAVGGASCPGAAARVPISTRARACASRRRILVHLRGVRRASVRRVTVVVNGKRRRVLGGPRSAVRVSLTGRARGIYRIRLVIRTRGGRRVVDARTYRTCVKRRR